MKIQIDAPDGKKYEVEVPQGADPGAVADQFGQEMGWNKAAPLSAALPEKNEFENTAAITAAGAVKGARESANPLSLLAGLASAGRGAEAALPGYAAASSAIGITPDDIAKVAARNASKADPLAAHKVANPGLYQAYTGLTGDTIGDSPQVTAQKRNAPFTPLRKGLASAAEIGAGALPFVGLGPGVGTALKFATAGAALGGLGDATLGSSGKTLGTVAPILASPVAGLARLGTRAARNVTAPFTDRGLQGMADRAVLEASETTPQALAKSLAPPSLAGQPATLGQRTGNRGLLDAEYALHGKVPNVEDSYRTTSRIAGDEMKALAGTTEREGSQALRGALTSAYQREKALVTPDIERVKDSLSGIAAKGDALKGHINAYTGFLTQARHKWLNDAGLSDLRELAKGKSIALNEVDDVLAGMKAKVRDMPAGSPEKLEVGKFVSHMQGGMEKIVPDMGPAYRQYAQFKGDFDNNKLIGKLFARNSDRTFKIPPSEIGDVLRRMPSEAIEQVAKVSPGVKKSMRDWLAASWHETSTTANVGTRASGTPNLAGALKFRQDNDVMFKAAFSKDDLTRADRIIEALKAPSLPEFGQRRFGSPTYNKFVKGTLIEGIVGRIVGKIPGGGMLNQALGNFVFSKPIAQLEQKIADALLNPDQTVARLLLAKASPGNARLLGHYLWAPRGPALGALSGQGTQPPQEQYR